MAALYRVAGFDEAVALANDSPYGLTAAIHTASVHRAMQFAERVAAGVVVVNAGTHGSEPHMGFGGVKQSGTGWKEAGLESLDVYSETPVREPGRRPRAHVTRPVAVLGIGGVGGVLAVRTGALCVGTERTVAAIRGLGAHARPRTRRPRWHIPRPSSGSRRPSGCSWWRSRPTTSTTPSTGSRRRRSRGAVVLPLLNGLDHVEAIRARFEARGDSPESRPAVLAGSIGRLEAFSSEPGVVVQRSPGAPSSTPRPASSTEPALDAALEPLRVPGDRRRRSATTSVPSSGRRRRGSRCWRRRRWRAASRSGRSVRIEAWRPRLVEALREACAVAAADGVALDAAAQWAIIEAMPDDLTTSAARDAAAGRPTELDAITGSVVRAGARLGVPTPALAALLEEAACRAR